MKKLKYFAFVLIIAIFISTFSNVFALETETTTDPPPENENWALYKDFLTPEEAELYMNPSLDELTPEELAFYQQEGLAINNARRAIAKPRNAYDNLAIVISKTNSEPTYTTSSLTTSTGKPLDPREIVSVIGSTTSAYQIRYLTPSGYVTGWIAKSKLSMPTYGFARPIRTGNRTLDYQDYYQGQYHAGVDVGVASGTPVYAIDDSTVYYRQSTAVIGGTTYFVGFGKYVELVTDSSPYLTVIYGHLSSFYGVTSDNYPSYSSSYNGPLTITTKHTNTSKLYGSTLGYTGNTGYSSGPHLHLQMSRNGSLVDPHIYTIFPDVGYLI